MNLEKNNIKHKNIIIEEISRDIEYYLDSYNFMITLLLCNSSLLIFSYITSLGPAILGIISLTTLEFIMFATLKVFPINELNRAFLKEKNKRLIKKYHLKPEELVEETYSIIKVRRNIKGENQSLKRNIKKTFDINI